LKRGAEEVRSGIARGKKGRHLPAIKVRKKKTEEKEG